MDGPRRQLLCQSQRGEHKPADPGAADDVAERAPPIGAAGEVTSPDQDELDQSDERHRVEVAGRVEGEVGQQLRLRENAGRSRKLPPHLACRRLQAAEGHGHAREHPAVERRVQVYGPRVVGVGELQRSDGPDVGRSPVAPLRVGSGLFQEVEGTERASGRWQVIRPDEQVDVGRGPRAGLREVPMPRVRALQHRHRRVALDAERAAPAVVQMRGEHVRNGPRRVHPPGFAPPPQQGADPRGGGRDAKRPGIHVGRKPKRHRPGSVRQHGSSDPRDCCLGRAECGDGHLGPEVARVECHGVSRQPRVHDFLWLHVPKASRVRGARVRSGSYG